VLVFVVDTFRTMGRQELMILGLLVPSAPTQEP
jgi:hypothetical protein